MKNKNLLYIGVFVAAFVGLLVFKQAYQPPEDPKIAAFAQCLTEKSAAMYGADWCPHCQNQKRTFGAAFKRVTYIQCDKTPNVCIEKNVTGYPTWVFADGSKLEGEVPLATLGEKAGCEL